MFAKVFDHISPLNLAVDQHIQPGFFLEADDMLDLLLEKGFIALTVHFATLISSPRCTDLRRLRIGTKRCGRLKRQLEYLLLELLAHTVWLRTLSHLLCDGLDTLSHFSIVNAR